MPVVPNKDFNSFLSGGDPKKTPSIGMDDLSESGVGYGNVTVPVPPVVIPQSSTVLDRNMGGISPDFQFVDAPESTQVINNQQPVTPYQNIISSVLKSVQNNGKLINQGSDPVFDYIRQQQANSIYPDLGNTTNADYYPSAGVMSTSTSDPMYGSFNQYATQSLTPYAIYDKRNTALQKAAAASLPSGMTNKVPDAYVSYKDDVGEKTLSTTQNAIKEVANAGYGKYGYEILEKGIGEIGQRYQRDISNINTIASKTKDIGKYVDDIWLKESEGAFLPTPIKDAITKFKSGATDLWSGKGTDLELDKLVGMIQSAPNMMEVISKNKFAQDEYTTMIQDSGLKNIGQNKELTYQEVKQVLKPRADKLAEEIWNSNPQYKQYYTKDQISNMIIESNGTQVNDVYRSVSLKTPTTIINNNTGTVKTKQDLVFNEAGVITTDLVEVGTGKPTTRDIKYDYGFTFPSDQVTTVSVSGNQIKTHNAGKPTASYHGKDLVDAKALGIFRVPVDANGTMYSGKKPTKKGWYIALSKTESVSDENKNRYDLDVTYYVPFTQQLQQQIGYTVEELNNTVNTSIQPSAKTEVEPDVKRLEIPSEKMSFKHIAMQNGVYIYSNDGVNWVDANDKKIED